jgi:hypothetical protein
MAGDAKGLGYLFLFPLNILWLEIPNIVATMSFWLFLIIDIYVGFGLICDFAKKTSNITNTCCWSPTNSGPNPHASCTKLSSSTPKSQGLCTLRIINLLNGNTCHTCLLAINGFHLVGNSF